MGQPNRFSDDDRRVAFERHVVPHLGVLLHVARSMTSREHDAEDLVQDTLARAFSGIEGFDGAHPRAWLFTIMRNTQINRVRKRRPELLADPDVSERLADAGSHESPEQAAEAAAFSRVVADAVGQLPERMAMVVELVDMDGLSYADAALALNIPVGTVMSRLHRARRKIRSRLIAEGLGPQGGTR
jgi:RNA polymerase sigma-70 factor (ECF subfamily)